MTPEIKSNSKIEAPINYIQPNTDTPKWLIHVQIIENKGFIRSCKYDEAVKPYFLDGTLETNELLTKVKAAVQFLSYFTKQDTPERLTEFELKRREEEEQEALGNTKWRKSVA